jgi:molecular chaperone GrpE
MEENKNNGKAEQHQDEHQKGKSKKKKDDRKEEQIKELQSKVDELNDKYIRLYSEFDNYRKRTLKERTELTRTASEDIITSLLPVIDDFERAIKAFETAEDDAATEGVLLIYNKFRGILEQQGLEAIDPSGEDFNADYHDALTSIPVPSPEMKGKIIDVLEKGYKLNGKVIRYSKVMVGS